MKLFLLNFSYTSQTLLFKGIHNLKTQKSETLLHYSQTRKKHEGW